MNPMEEKAYTKGRSDAFKIMEKEVAELKRKNYEQLYRIREIIAASTMRMIFLSNALSKDHTEMKEESNRWIRVMDEAYEIIDKII